LVRALRVARTIFDFYGEGEITAERMKTAIQGVSKGL
jgi:predicted ATPase with chaperone activity